MIHELDPKHCHGTDIRIKDYLQDIISKTEDDLKEDIVRTVGRLNSVEKALAFPYAKDINEYL